MLIKKNKKKKQEKRKKLNRKKETYERYDLISHIWRREDALLIDFLRNNNVLSEKKAIPFNLLDNENL